jgi:signal transduction histidine kinase
MRRGAKPAKPKVEAKSPRAPKSRKREGSRVRDPEARLAEAREQLQTRDRELVEALEQQAATSDVLRIISRSSVDLQTVLQEIAETAARVCGASDGVVFLTVGMRLRIMAHHGAIGGRIGQERDLDRASVAGRAAVDRMPVHVSDLQAETNEFPTGSGVARQFGHRTTLAVPLLRDGVALGALLIRRLEVRPFLGKQVALLQTFADQAVIAIENVRLFTELQARNRELSTALDTQTATSDILRVISRSQTDVQPVFDAIVASAVRLLMAYSGAMTRVEADQIVLAALTGIDDAGAAAVRSLFPQPLQSLGPYARAVLAGAPFNSADLQTDARVPEFARAAAQARGFHSWVVVPMLRHDEALGTISVARREPGGFSADEIALLQTFADQAVIAIENVRLFTELQEKNQALTEAHAQVTEALEQQTSTSEILRVISESPAEVQPVFDAIVRSGAVLCHAPDVLMLIADSESLRVVASVGPVAAAVQQSQLLRGGLPLTRGSVSGRAFIDRQTVHVHDVGAMSDAEFPEGKMLQRQYGGHGTTVAVPLLREDVSLGVITLLRNEVSPFTDRQVALLRTFADQAVIAIENVRLFKELEAANRELGAASRHKSEFLANMSHELRTPLNAIIGFSEVLAARMFGEVNAKQAEYLQDILESGRHLLSLINDILDLSKIEAGRMELEPADFDLPSAIENALILVRERAGRHGIALASTVDERLGLIRGDERKVKQVLLNLLSNALKFTSEGGRIDVRAALREGRAEVSVADTGVGIAPEDQEAVFEEFRQVGTADKKVEGTGLGLALSRKFIELHGGRIWVESELGRGSTFTFTLPVS